MAMHPGSVRGLPVDSIHEGKTRVDGTRTYWHVVMQVADPTYYGSFRGRVWERCPGWVKTPKTAKKYEEVAASRAAYTSKTEKNGKPMSMFFPGDYHVGYVKRSPPSIASGT